MPDFDYTAKSTSGETISGAIVAGNKREALAMLTKQSLYPIEVAERRSGAIDWLPKRGVKASLVAETLKQLADLLENGVPMLGALDVLVDQTAHPTLRAVVVDLRERIADGEAIDVAFASHPKVFNELTISIIRAGAEGAFLEDAFKRSAAFIEKQTEMKGRILAAMIYPSVLVAVGVTVMTILLLVIVPKFETVFERVERQDGGLPVPTIIVLGASTFVAKYWIVILVGVVVGGLYFWSISRKKSVRRVLDRVKLKIPALGPVLLTSAVSRFCRVLGTLLANGVPLLRSLEISSDSTGNQVLADAILAAADAVSAGEPLAKPLANAGIIPPSIMAMITVAEESNNLENVLVNISETLERQLNHKVEVMVRLVEPLLLIVIGACVALIMMGVFMPVLQLQG